MILAVMFGARRMGTLLQHPGFLTSGAAIVSVDVSLHISTHVTLVAAGIASPRVISAARRHRAKQIAEVRMIVW
jgi:hypothetical protein